MITNEGSSTNLKGLSTDTKPTDVEINTLFLELDTGDFYYFDTDDDWHKVGGDTTEDSNTKSNIRTEPMGEIKAEIGEEKEIDDRSEYAPYGELKKENTEVKQIDPAPIKGGDDE